MSLVELFCDVDDFLPIYQRMLSSKQLGQHRRRGPKPTLCVSEIMTIVIFFHMTRHRDFKTYYNEFVCVYLRDYFPKIVAYNRFVELMPRVLGPLCAYLTSRYGHCTGLQFIDSTPLAVCHNKRIKRHRVFAGLAARGRSSMGWFYGFKLHLVVNEHGELLGCQVTAGNVDDRKPVPDLSHQLFGKMFGDKGYLSADLFQKLFMNGLQLITNIRSNMQNRLMTMEDKIMLRKRFIIETINDQLKNISQIEHSRHRSVHNFAVNLLAGLIAYTHQAKKPSLNLTKNDCEAALALI